MSQQLRVSTRDSRVAFQPITNIKNIPSIVRKGTLNAVCNRIETASAANEGRMPHKYMAKLIAELQSDKATSWITKDMIKGRCRRRLIAKKLKQKQTSESAATIGLLALSKNKHDNIIAPVLQDTATSVPRNKGGRPKGSTVEDGQERKNKQERVTNIAAIEYAKKCEQYHKKGKICPKGTLVKVIEDAKIEVGVTNADLTTICESTIRSRVKRQKLEPVVPRGGLVTPMLSIEPLLVMFCAKLASARRPIGPAGFIELANGLIKGTEVEKQTIAFKAKHCGGDPKATSANVGKKYYQGFMKRNRHLLRSKRGESFANDRSEWSTYTNFKHMYAHTYEELVESGNAIKLSHPVYLIKRGMKLRRRLRHMA